MAPVERAILDQADRQKGEATFWVIVREKANLAAAYGIQQRSVRGRFVYDQLTTVAAKSQAGLQALLRARGASFKPFWIANAIRVTGDRALIDELARRPEVERIVGDRVFTLEPPVPGVDEAQISGVEWGIDRIQAPLVWSTFSDRGEGIVVASIDTGVTFDHPALVNQYRGNLGAGNFNHNYSWFDPSNACGSPSLVPCDNNGHGTHTMGTMAGDDGNGNQIGVAPHVKWIAAKGCEQGSCSNAALLAAGQWILAPTDLNGQNARPDLRPHIVNNSWGSDASDTFYQATVQAWIASGIFPAFSNGNTGPACGTVGAPAGYAESYGAGAFDINNLIAAFSSRGPAPTSVGASIKPDLAAPGVNIRSAWNDGGYNTISGTSMASPHLAGAVALMWSAAPSLIGNIAGTRALLGQTAIDTSDLTCGGTAANNNVWGEGRLDAFAAVGAAPRGPTGTLTGIVTDSSGSPIQGATIAVSGPTSRTTPTGSAGDYIVLLPVGSYNVAASAFGYLTQSANAVVINDGQTIALPFTLAAAPAHAISGHVTDSFLHPVAGATVTVLGAPATTDGNGFYSFARIPEGTYTIKAEGGRCRNPDTKALTVDADKTVDFLLTARSDSFGYFCREETASYVEANIVVALTGDDAAAPINLPFPFPFYGQTYNSAQLATNGFLNFIASSTSFSNSVIPSPAVPNAAIYPYWDDLFVVDGSSSVRTDLFGSAPGRQFVIEWRNVAYLNDLTKRVDFEVILHENGQILIQYRNIGNDAQERGNSATVGIEDQTGSIALQYAVNEAALSDTVAIRYLLAPQAILQGTVTDTNDGLPIAGASVKAFQGSAVSAQTTTDANGFYRMPLLLGTYDLQALKTNYITALASVPLSTPDGTVTRNLALKTGRLTVNPSTLEFIMTAGQAGTANLALANTGTESLTWLVSESPTAVSWLSEGSGGGNLAAGSNATVLVGVNSTGLAAGVYDTTLLFSSDSGRQPSVTVSVRLVVSGYSKAIDAGGGAYTDGGGISWLADRVYAAGQYGYTSKQSSISTTTIAIAATTDDPLYQSARVDPGEYRFDGLPAGVYEVDLRFAEIQNQAPASRLFDITVEGKVVLTALDVAKEVGTFTADRHVFFLSITDGKANIGFAARRGSAKPVVSGLRLTHRPDK